MGADEPFSTGRILIVAAHPDDEVIGAGAQLPAWRGRLDIVHATDGSPGNDSDYAAARRAEVLNAVALAGVKQHHCHQLGFVDQQASFHLVELARRILGCLDRLRPRIVLTHPYEGGHPDHDACSFAVHLASARQSDPRASAVPEIWEFTSYHMGPHCSMETGVFLSSEEDSGSEVRVFSLSDEQQTMKRRMFDHFESQQHVLANFQIEAESFRRAPRYDFTQPPHPGQLFYEQFEWGVTGPRWRQLAAEALSTEGSQLHATHSS